jgi:NADH-quinone oxidoreductase subunit M
VLSGSFGVHLYWTVAATLGVILSAVYMLSMLQRVLYGEPSPRVLALGPAPSGGDLTLREQSALWPLLALIVLMGVLSPYWMRAIDGVYGNQPAQARVVAPMQKAGE